MSQISTFDNAPPPPGWVPECRCGECDTCRPAPAIGPNIILGSE